MLAEKRGAVMSCRGIRIGLWVTVIISLSFPITLCAAPKLNIKPKFSASWRADSNFYYAQDTERDVYTYTLQPGVEVGLETAKSALILDYTLDAKTTILGIRVPWGPDTKLLTGWLWD
jgi:hypothetical protein